MKSLWGTRPAAVTIAARGRRLQASGIGTKIEIRDEGVQGFNSEEEAAFYL
jgi:hypothetical protein